MSIACPSLIADSLPALCRTIDVYCERTGAAFDAEPLNAATSLAMLPAAFAAGWLQAVRPNRDAAGLIRAMIALISVGAVGAFLFHTTATVWAVWLDMMPFLGFMLLVIWLTFTRFFGWPPIAAGAAVLAFFAVTFGGGPLLPRGFLPGGAYYLPPLFVLAAVAIALRLRRSPAATSYAVAAVVFVAAFAARELDMPLCGSFPLGTHFLWHLLAAVLAYVLIRAAVLHAPPAGPSTLENARKIAAG